MIVPRTSVLEAVSAAIAADIPLSDEIPGGVWTGEIPENPGSTRPMPYASLEVDSTDYEFTSGDKDYEKTRFSIIVFGTGAQVVDNLLDRLEAFLTEADLTFTNNDELVFLFPGRRTTRSEFARDKDGNQVFTGAVLFEAGVFRH